MSLSLYVGSVLTEGGLFCFVVHTIPSALLITVKPQCPLMPGSFRAENEAMGGSNMCHLPCQNVPLVAKPSPFVSD